MKIRHTGSVLSVLGVAGAVLFGAVAGATVLGVAPAGAATSGVSLVYVSTPLQSGSFGEVVAAVPTNSNCKLSIKRRGHIEATSPITSSPTGEIDFVWTVPAEITGGSRTALVRCAGGSTASSAIAVMANAQGSRLPIATTIEADAIDATDPPTIAGKGGGSYPPYGSVLLSGSQWFGGKGVNVYSDGSNGGDGYYQCVELANRFMTTEGFGPVIWGNANQLYKDAQPAYYQDHANGSGYIPVPGDLVVFGGGQFGHVAVVDSVIGSSVNLVEQNASPTGRAVITLSGSTLGGEYDLTVIGVIHAIANGSSNSSGPPKNPPTTSPPSGSTYTETTGGVTNTWTDYSDAGGTDGPQIGSNTSVDVACKITGFTVSDGNTWWYEIASTPWSDSYYASADAFYNNGQTSGSLMGTPFVDQDVPTCATGSSTPNTFNETTGGVTHTWTDYADAGGTEGPSIGSNQTVAITCRLTGFTVADGNVWWYEIASSPWSNSYYASADAFYNNGQTSGSLLGTPFYDPNVPVCSGPPGSVNETTGGVTHTWTDSADAGGTEGPSIASNQTVAITCRLTGFAVADGNTWWYEIASSPWSNGYYASADAFYNNGQTSGSLLGTPFVDTNVPTC